MLQRDALVERMLGIEQQGQRLLPVEVTLDREKTLTLLFDPEHALDERIALEQFAT